MEKTLELVITQIIKDDKFKLDKISSFYYINNRVDNTFLFEYHPLRMTLHISDVVFEFIKYNRLLGQGNLKKQIVDVMDTIFGLQFIDASIVKRSEITSIRYKYLANKLNKDIQSDIIQIPRNYLNIEKIELQLRSHNDFEKNKHRKLKSKKIITGDFDIIDISDMHSGYYTMWIYLDEPITCTSIHLEIKNDEIFVV